MTDIPLQGTPEWHRDRLGKVTASRIDDVDCRIKSGYGASRANYMAELIAEILTGIPTERYVNGAMQWGTEKEPEGRAYYELYRGVSVDLVGFVPHPSISRAGASPDGFVGGDGLVEIKAPLTATHIKTLRGGAIDGKYLKQMQWQMACTGRVFCDFVSYDPRMPVEMQTVIIRVDRDDMMIRELETEVKKFLAELEATIADLQVRYAPPQDDRVNILAGG